MAEPKNVTEAIALIASELGGIGKDQKASAQQGGYAYRGIEDITARLQPLLAKYQVVFFPQAFLKETRELEVNGKPWTDTFLTVTYEVVHGPSDTERIVIVPGIGRDNSDKGSNKAMTQAFKYALLQTFCISDPADDADAGSPATEKTGGGKSGATSSSPSRLSQHETTRPAPTGGMTLRELHAALEAAGLSQEGTRAEKEKRLAEATSATPLAEHVDKETGELLSFSDEPF